ncbi:MAG: DUF2341 domain-containing protein [Kiritimatiellae bacterium]|nr:DUF2341 domain-containing protein [Kiritimatiellia bacterium]
MKNSNIKNIYKAWIKNLRTVCNALAISVMAFALPAYADWTLSGTSGEVSMSDGTYTLYLTVLDSEARTLMLGKTSGGSGKGIRSLATGGESIGGSFDLSQRIVDANGNEWTIVEVGPYAFYNNKVVTGTIYIPTVTNIADGAFGYATSVSSFTLGNKLERIGASAFNSTFGNISFSPSFPSSLKHIGAAAFAHHTKWDLGQIMKLQGTLELRGIETIEKSAFYRAENIEKVIIGSKLTSFCETGSSVDSMEVTKGAFERCDKLHTIEWHCEAPATFPQNTFWTDQTSFCVTNYVYIDYLDGWKNLLTASGMTVGELVSGNDPTDVAPADYDLTSPAVYSIQSNLATAKGKIYLSLLPGHPAVEGTPVFNTAPEVKQENNRFIFSANMDEGEACDLFAVFKDLQGNAITNTLATEVNGNPDVYYTCEPTGLVANKIYSYALLGKKGDIYVERAGANTFFNGEISVEAPAAVSENGGELEFTFTRGNAADTGLADGEVIVPFTLSGTASEFTNFKEIVRTVTIPAGAASATVTVETVVDLASGNKTLSLIPAAGMPYFVGAAETATIEDWIPPAISDFTNTTKHTVSGYDKNKSTLSNFPVLVRIPAGQVADNTQLAFFDANDTFLPYEIDTWNEEGESLVWVLMPSLSQDAQLTMASGNENWSAPNLAYALWRTAGYVAVIHLGEDGPAFAGSTIQGISGVGQLANGADADSANKVDGAIGSARLITEASGGNKARIKVDNFEGYVDNLANITISFWVKHSENITPQANERLFGNRSNVGDQATGFNAMTVSGVNITTPIFEVRSNPTQGSAVGLDAFVKVQPSAGTETSWSDTWTHMSFTYNVSPNPAWFHIAGSRASISGNGQGGSTQSTSFPAILPNHTPVSFGNSYDEDSSATGFKGSMDEIRVKNGSVSDDWAFAENETVANAKFLVSGADVSIAVNSDKILCTEESSVDLSFQAQLLGTSESVEGKVTIDWGDGTTTATDISLLAENAVEVPASHIYTATGTYIVTATVTLNGFTSSDIATAKVGVLPKDLSFVNDDSFTRYALLYTQGYTGDSSLTDFPILVRISESTIEGFDYDECNEDGSDISFSLPDGTVLPYEIETWDTTGESLVWVKVPSITGYASAIYMRWNDTTPPENDPSAVWSSYVAVIHGGDNITNSVANSIVAESGSDSTVASATSGYIAGGVNKSVNNAIGLNITNPYSTLANGNQYSVSAWFKRDGNGGNNRGTHILAASRSEWSAGSGFLLLQEQGKYISVASNNSHNWSSGTGVLADKTWGHVSFTYDGDAGLLKSYFNGDFDQIKVNPGSLVNTSNPYWTFGSYMNRGSDDSLKGDMDEIRVYNGVATEDWLKAEYDSMANAAFINYGAATEASTAQDLIEATFTVDVETITLNAATISGTLITASTNGLSSADLYLAYGPASESLPEYECYTNGWEQGSVIAIPLTELSSGTTYKVSFIVSNANDVSVKYNLDFTTKSEPADLRISEVGSAITDPWDNTSSFVEIYNAGETTANLNGFVLRRAQKGKTKDMVLPPFTLAPGAYAVVWGSDDNEGYENPAEVVGSVIRQGVMKFKATNTPLITLLDADSNVLDTFQVLAGLADGQSMGPSADFDGVNLYYFSKKKITPGAANNYDGATALGASFVSESHSEDEVAPTSDLIVNSTWSPLPGSTIASVKMVYRLAFSNEVEVAMTDSGDGETWTATIPASVYADALPGSLVRWRFVATDSEGRSTIEPAFGSADGSPKYFGTITAPDFECEIPVFHLFVAAPDTGTDLPDDPTDDQRNLAAMDIDSDALTSNSNYADMDIGARATIYHNGYLYDNITIDLRGNTSAGFHKKSHGLKFNKSNKLIYVNPYTQEEGEVRKTSFTSEFMDPSFLRQNVAFQFLNNVGIKAPFHYPVRLQRNGEFYQLGFHSIRFTDEIIDYYGWDEDCELVKNAGSLRTTKSTAGFETKIPEQDNESLATDNFKALVSDLTSNNKSVIAWDILDIAKWINYMAATRITQETDDVWGNLCVYLHNETGTWWPGAYDMNLSFGQYYREAGWTAQSLPGEIANIDTFKSHPLYGGSQVRVYNKGTANLFTGGGGTDANYNGAFDAIYGDAKLRGMHLRRLRTLMDTYLMAPGTAQANTPIWQMFATQTNAMYATACLDRAKWTDRSAGNAGIINPWGNNFYTNMIDGVNSIWTNYIVPRRTHLYVTHSAANADYDSANVFTAVSDGKVVCYNAGIPDAQPAGLKVRISRRIVDANGVNSYIKVDNPNAIFLDVSDWTISDGTTIVILEPGTVIPPAGALYLVVDRKAFTAAHPQAQVLLQGNIVADLLTSDAAITVTDTADFVAATYSNLATAPANEAITEDADPFADPTKPTIGLLSDGSYASLSIEPGENEGDPSVLVIPFAAEAGFTYTLKMSTTLETPTDEWAAAEGVEQIIPADDGNAAFRIPMTEDAAFFIISVE